MESIGNENKIMQKKILLSSAYFPCVDYIKAIYNNDSIIIEKNEHYLKQTYRNRTQIASPNGIQSLSIPIVDAGKKEAIGEKKISRKENWPLLHFKTIRNNYKNSPWYDFLEDEFQTLFESKSDYLIDFNLEILQWILKLLRIKKEIQFSETFEKNPTDKIDLRNFFHPKIKNTQTVHVNYQQIFIEKNGFIPNLSIIDLIFAEGIKLEEYLKA